MCLPLEMTDLQVEVVKIICDSPSVTSVHHTNTENMTFIDKKILPLNEKSSHKVIYFTIPIIKMSAPSLCILTSTITSHRRTRTVGMMCVNF